MCCTLLHKRCGIEDTPKNRFSTALSVLRVAMAAAEAAGREFEEFLVAETAAEAVAAVPELTAASSDAPTAPHRHQASLRGSAQVKKELVNQDLVFISQFGPRPSSIHKVGGAVFEQCKGGGARPR